MQILFCILFCLVSCSATKPTNICINCQHFKNDWRTPAQFGKCMLFPTEPLATYNLVSGIKTKQFTDYYHCVVARKYENMCGKEGNMYKTRVNSWFGMHREQEP